jgi:hypothetical protein
MTETKFLKNILDYYIKAEEESNSNLEEFICHLPKLQQMKMIFLRQLFSRKDLILVKMILDIYEHYFKKNDHPLFQKLQEEYLPTAIIFYSSLSDEDTEYMYEKLRNALNKELSELLSKFILNLIRRKET